MSTVDVESKKRWYVLRARAGHERRVVENLKALVEKESLQDQVGDIVMPTEEVLEVYKGRQRKVPRKFFPGYVLINAVLSDATLQLIRHARNKSVLGFLGSGDTPVPLSQREVDDIFGRLNATEGKPRPKVLFQPGQEVKIIAGPFAGFSGVIEEADYEKKNRLRVSVVVFQRVTSVELEFSEVKAA